MVRARRDFPAVRSLRPAIVGLGRRRQRPLGRHSTSKGQDDRQELAEREVLETRGRVQSFGRSLTPPLVDTPPRARRQYEAVAVPRISKEELKQRLDAGAAPVLI